VVLEFGDLLEFRRNYPEIPEISYDGKVFPFRDRQFDIVHANAVIERVGPFEAQGIFLREMVRVSKRGMISTPNIFSYRITYKSTLTPLGGEKRI